MSAEKTLLILLISFLTISGVYAYRVTNTDGADLKFREIMIEKSLAEKDFSCTVTQGSLPDALIALREEKTDIVLLKDGNFKIPADFASVKFGESFFTVFVHSSNPVRKMKLSDLKKIWNEDISSWQTFNKNNVFSLHRFGMRSDDSAFVWFKKYLSLKKNADHFPLENAQYTINMVRGNPNAIGIAVMEKSLDFKGVSIVQLTDDNGKNIHLAMPHIAVCRKSDRAAVAEFLNVRKD